MEEIVKRLHEQRRVEKAKEILESEGYSVKEDSAYKCYALMEYEPGNGETGIEGDKFFILDVVKAGDEGEANRYFKNLRGRFPGAYVTEISEDQFNEFMRNEETVDESISSDEMYEGLTEYVSEYIKSALDKIVEYAVEDIAGYNADWSKKPTDNHIDNIILDLSQAVAESMLYHAPDMIGENIDEASDVKYDFVLNKNKNEYDEYVIKAYKNGKYDEEATYYTDDWDDAVGTFNALVKQYDLPYRHVGRGFTTKGVTESLKMRESNYIRRVFPTEQEAWDYARDNGLEVSKTQDCEDKCVAWFRKLDYKPEQKREELPEEEK